MIIVKKSGYLKYKNLKFPCALGKAGIKKKKKEGDNITPKGIFRLIKVYYRSDRIKKIKTSLKKNKIKNNMGWCDDPESKFYNKLIRIPSSIKYEKLYRKDHLYDIVIPLNYNMNPTIKNKGSAIFLHLTKKKYTPTKGCVGLSKVHLLKILEIIKPNTKVKLI
jgi:L,D-peptidoglycan transpeptidase YkuD (ErfK/YbiS/YcfS/YnhG family)